MGNLVAGRQGYQVEVLDVRPVLPDHADALPRVEVVEEREEGRFLVFLPDVEAHDGHLRRL